MNSKIELVSCNNICRTEATASTSHASEAGSLALAISGFDNGAHAILHPLVGVVPWRRNFERYIAEIADGCMMPMSGAF
jgi:hypothetical protein